MERPSFLDQEPPVDYVPGIGRGATGFSTKEKNTLDDGGRRIPKRYREDSNSNYQSQTEYNEDEEAAKVFETLDLKLAQKKKKRTNDNSDHNAAGTSIVKAQFADLKETLGAVTEDEWMNIPDATDFTRRNKRNRIQEQLNRKTYAAPDSLMPGNVDLNKLTEEREKLLQSQIDANIAELTRNTTSRIQVDKSGAATDALSYLKDLENDRANSLSDTALEDLQKMRTVLRSYRQADPTNPQGWIASARLEEKAKKFSAAKKLIENGCQDCPKNSDVWLENIRLHESDIHHCKILVATAIKFNPASPLLWLKAVDLESTTINKYRVVRKALQEIPRDERLWKLAVSFETDKTQAIRMLEKATRFIPQSMSLLAAYINLQDYHDAKMALNSSRKVLPQEPEIWILAALLEERNDPDVAVHMLVNLLKEGLLELSKKGCKITLSAWFNRAETLSDTPNAKSTCQAIIYAVLESLKENAEHDSELYNIDETVEKMQNSVVKFIILKKLIQWSPCDMVLWSKLKTVAEEHHKIEELLAFFQELLFCPKSDDTRTIIKEKSPYLFMMYANEYWRAHKGNTRQTLNIIDQIIDLVPYSLDVRFFKIKLLGQSSQFDELREFFHQTFIIFRDSKINGIERLYYKYVDFLRYQDLNKHAIEFLNEKCLKKFPNCPKFFLQLGQIYHSINNIEMSRQIYLSGTKIVSDCASIWISLSKIDEVDSKNSIRARSILDRGLLKNRNNVSFYIAKVQMEIRLGNLDQATLLATQALQKFSNNALLWVERIKLLNYGNTSSSKKIIFQDALKRTQNDYRVLLEIGISFYRETQYQTSLKWLERALKKSPEYGDTWVWLFRTYAKLEKDPADLHELFDQYEPIYGPEWTAVAKNVKMQYCTKREILLHIMDKKIDWCF
ncbi:Prp6p [Saccharomyces cerevisiae x Saccharomyces kudriavzevii VIN7]|uniref:Prp6p n=1 Tax=Saccharomyces cerevisiae x Saccharomyces kudriavzevii (strain VIN7) TaxID=1095631 RepID=H0GR78_SACCK|nr:Prp6p [Saccharomyces cerevisiae x Saccharomyces kudriavzevii VIN7]